jgi:hypothetical protein
MPEPATFGRMRAELGTVGDAAQCEMRLVVALVGCGFGFIVQPLFQALFRGQRRLSIEYLFGSFQYTALGDRRPYRQRVGAGPRLGPEHHA